MSTVKQLLLEQLINCINRQETIKPSAHRISGWTPSADALEEAEILEKALKEAASIKIPDELKTALRSIIKRLPTTAMEKLIQDQLEDVLKLNRYANDLRKRTKEPEKKLIKYKQKIAVLRKNVNDLSMFMCNDIDGTEGSIKKSTRNVGLQVRMKPIFKASPRLRKTEVTMTLKSEIISAPETYSPAPNLTGVDDTEKIIADCKSEEIDLTLSDDESNKKSSGIKNQKNSGINENSSSTLDLNFTSPVPSKYAKTIIHDLSLLNESGDASGESELLRKEVGDTSATVPPLEPLWKSPSATATDNLTDLANRKRSLPGTSGIIMKETWYDPRLIRGATSSIPAIINKPELAAKKMLIVAPNNNTSHTFQMPLLAGAILTRPSMKEPLILKGQDIRAATIPANSINLPIPDLMPVSPYVEFIPVLKLKRIHQDGAGVNWDIPNLSPMKINQILSYELFARQDAEPQEEWQRIAMLKALPLPMGCSISKFERGYRYLFRIRTIIRCDEESFETGESPFSKVTTVVFD